MRMNTSLLLALLRMAGPTFAEDVKSGDTGREASEVQADKK